MKIGIYKMISPSGRIYIGQSINIEKRKKRYCENIKNQPKLYNSFLKYGFDAHDFDIIEECSLEQLNERETHWKIYYLAQVKGDWKQVLFCNV